jgi:phage-related protein
MSSDKSLGVNLIGRDLSASKALKKVADSARETGGAFSRIKEIAAGVFSAHLFEKAGDELLKFGKESLTAFTDVGKQVAKTQRMIGGTVEDASRLRYAFVESGLSVDQAQMSIKKFAQAVDSNNKHFKELRISTRDASGHQKSFNAILLDTAEKFKNMPNGIHKTAAAVNLFGRTGLDMLKFLNKGKKGLEELEAEAQKYGLVLTKDNMKAVADSIEAHKALSRAVEGVQVQIGAHLTPILTKAMVGFTQIFPIILKYVNPAFKKGAEIIAPYVNTIRALIAHVIPLIQHFIHAKDSLSKFHDIGKNAKIIFHELGEVFKILLSVLKPVWTFIMKYLAPVLLFLIDVVFKALALASKVVVTALRWIVDVFKDIISVARGVGHIISNVFSFVLNGVKAYINTIISLINFVIGIINKIHFKIPSWVPKLGGKEFGVNIPKIPMLADGGIVNKPTLAMIGEAGPEAVVPLKSGFGQGMIVNVHVAGSVIAEKDLAVKVRNEMAQLLRRKGLNPAILGV